MTLFWYRIIERSRDWLRLRLTSDRRCVMRQFEARHGYPANLDHPETWSEKIQWIKLYDRNPLYTLCSDKYRVRDYVAEHAGKQHLVPLLGVFDDAAKIDFDALPEQFVVKANHGSGWNRIVRDNGKGLDRRTLVSRFSKWLARSYWVNHREWQYKDIAPRVVVEQLLLDDRGEVPADIKIHCFDHGRGEVVIGVDSDRFGRHRRDHYDIDWNRIDLTFAFPQSEHGVPRPSRLDEMTDLARALARPFRYVRVDLYLVGERIYVGELTFTPGSGYDPFVPEAVDRDWGGRFSVADLRP
jgi:hypothetical protein